MKETRYIASGLVGLAVLGLIVAIVSSWLPPSPKRVASDSYSGMITGYRALFETLQALGVPALRNEDVPSLIFAGERRVLLLDPDPDRLEREKGYLDLMEAWVNAGGEIVVAGNTSAKTKERSWHPSRHKDSERASKQETFAKHLGLEGLVIAGAEAKDEDERPLRVKWVETGPAATRPYAVRATGSLAPFGEKIKELSLPTPLEDYFEGDPVGRADGVIEVEDGADIWRPIGLEYRRGAGSVVAVADSTPFTNIGVGASDNAVLAVMLATGDGSREVVVDEYYHGVRIEGSIPTLLGMYPYGVIVLFILAAVLCRVWSNGVRFGPMMTEEPASRRSILEYVDAMASLLQRGRKEAFVLRTCRDGFVSDLRTEFQIEPSVPEAIVLEMVERLDTARADRLRAVLGDIDAALETPQYVHVKQLVELERRLESCRSSTKISPLPQRRIPSRRYTIAR